MSCSAVSIIAGASGAMPEPYSADSMASSNRKTSARSEAGTAVRAKGQVGFRCCQAFGHDVSHVGDQPDHRRSNVPKCVHRSTRGETLRASASLRSAERGAMPFALPDHVS